jgi:hypothetical protein
MTIGQERKIEMLQIFSDIELQKPNLEVLKRRTRDKKYYILVGETLKAFSSPYVALSHFTFIFMARIVQQHYI